MSKDNEKRELREMKREIKRLGNKKVRRDVKNLLEDNPDDALDIETDYGHFGTKGLNGLDRKPGGSIDGS